MPQLTLDRSGLLDQCDLMHEPYFHLACRCMFVPSQHLALTPLDFSLPSASPLTIPSLLPSEETSRQRCCIYTLLLLFAVRIHCSFFLQLDLSPFRWLDQTSFAGLFPLPPVRSFPSSPSDTRRTAAIFPSCRLSICKHLTRVQYLRTVSNC